MGDGNQIRDYLYVEDAVRAFVLVAERGLLGEVYNLGSGFPVRIRDLAEEIITAVKLKGVAIEYTMESWPGDIKAWYADTSKIRQLGFKPEISWEEGLRRTVSFFYKYPNGLK
jgi:nucleoside-diphosphate-sugar epimerase